MAWVRYTRATINSQGPRALGTCDRCGFIFNRVALADQYDWQGPRLQNLGIIVCQSCRDEPQQNGQRTIIIPPDPVPIMNARPDPYMFMGQSSSPDPYQSGSPNTIATESNNPLVTQPIGSIPSQPLITEIGEAISVTTGLYFMAVGGNASNDVPSIMASPNGRDWTEGTPTPSASAEFFSVAYNGSFWVVVGGVGGTTDDPIISTSADGVTWVARACSPATDAILYGVTYSPSLFMAVGAYRSGITDNGLVVTSEDGITWSQSSISAPNATLTCSAYGGGLYSVCGKPNSNPVGYRIYTSSTGTGNWTIAATGAGELLAIAYADSIFVAVGLDTDVDNPIIVTSSDGITWTPRTADPLTGWRINAVAWTGEEWVAVGVDSPGGTVPIISTSPDGVTWTQVTLDPSITDASLLGVGSYGGTDGAIVVVGVTTGQAPFALWSVFDMWTQAPSLPTVGGYNAVAVGVIGT